MNRENLARGIPAFKVTGAQSKKGMQGMHGGLKAN